MRMKKVNLVPGSVDYNLCSQTPILNWLKTDTSKKQSPELQI